MKYESPYHKLDFNFGILFASLFIFITINFLVWEYMSIASHFDSVAVNKVAIVSETTNFATKKFAESPLYIKHPRQAFINTNLQPDGICDTVLCVVCYVLHSIRYNPFSFSISGLTHFIFQFIHFKLGI